MERHRNNRGRNIYEPYKFVVEYTTQNEYIKFCEISQRKKQFNDILQIWGREICI